MNKVIHASDMKNHPDAVYVGRAMPRQRLKGSKFANPFKIGRDGNRQEVLVRYTYWMGAEGPIGDVPELRGRTLACWCRRDGEKPGHDNACHADILSWLLEENTDDELRAMAATK